jgi:hypothetical protein
MMIFFLSIVLVSNFMLNSSCDAFLVPISSPLHNTQVGLSLKLSKHEQYSSSCDDLASHGVLKRDQFLRTSTFLGFTIPIVANANGLEEDAKATKDASVTEKPFVKGIVELNGGGENIVPEETSSSALYITARPQRPDNVPRAILDGSNGKPPPVLACRIPNPSFPYEFELTKLDLTPEGAYFLDESLDRYWFEGENLIVSARWDTDGVASTRDPTDLVGRSQYFSQSSKNEEETLVTVELSGRGITGKLVTGKNKKS